LVHQYHDDTKHHFHQFARSLGYLDWASQPAPFRSYRGAPEAPLSPRPDAPVTVIGDVLRHALGLSAWKQFHDSRWSLRVNPSSGNLHPTEAYVISGAGLYQGVYHYAADRHALEQRCAFTLDWTDGVFLVALTSIHWREAWKYGERAFRYCQHDLGHAIAAVRIAAALAGLHARLLPEWSHGDIAALTGIDREEDFVEAEREEPECVMVLGPWDLGIGPVPGPVPGPGREPLLAAVRGGQWTGTASQLSEAHVEWTFIDEAACATRDPGRETVDTTQLPGYPLSDLPTRAIVLRRRSAVAFDGRSSISAETFFDLLASSMPSSSPPWDALWWDSRIHLGLFVHRIIGVEPGLYLLIRNPRAADALKTALTRDFIWQQVTDRLPLFQLARGDGRRLAKRVSCDQDIAADGFFSLGMFAEFDASLAEFGPSFYRHLFWESGVVGQQLYLAAEAAGTRATGIGCFYDDPVHEVFGLVDHTFQSLYHFTIGIPVEDTRLTTEPGYDWEVAGQERRDGQEGQDRRSSRSRLASASRPLEDVD
jgi:SagB-type dehydrogenase family enzyme